MEERHERWVMDIESKVKMIEEERESKTTGRLKSPQGDAWKKHSIYTLPHGFVSEELRLRDFKPQVVAFGLYRNWVKQAWEMEEHKERALVHFLVRTKKSIRQYREALRGGGVLQMLMDSYKDLSEWSREDEEGFLKMMILDGCFMMEVMKLATGNISAQEYNANDPIFSSNGMLSHLPRVKRDMLLIENQIPLFVLHKLHAVEKGVTAEQDKEKEMLWVNNMVLGFFDQETIETLPPPTIKQNNSSDPTAAAASTDDHDDAVVQDYMRMGLHVLDVVRKSMIKKTRRVTFECQPCGDMIWPATQLQEAGIKFQKSKSPSLMDITFQKGLFGLRPTLSLPQLVVDEATSSKINNLIAFEHLHVGSGKEVTSYLCFMESIIRSDKDVSLLSQNNIIKNLVGTDKAIACLFSAKFRDLYIDPDTGLNTVLVQVTKYCNTWCGRHRVYKAVLDLRRTYFNSPWSFISLVGAILLLSLTIIQTVYTIRQYRQPN